MTAPTYSLAGWRKHREAQERHGHGLPISLAMADIPPDAPMEEGIVLGCWNGEAFVSWEKWLASTPIAAQPPAPKPCLPDRVRCATAECGSIQVWLAKDGDRWLMYENSRSSSARRKDFASPFLEHAIRTAEQWYGKPVGGWQVEES